MQMILKYSLLIFILIFPLISISANIKPISLDNFDLIVTSTSAQQEKHHEYLLKSAFLERFTRFVQWPVPFSEINKKEPFIIGVIGPNPFGDILQAVFSRHPIKEHPVSIRLLNRIEDIQGCHMLFIGKTDDHTLSRIIEFSKKFPVLTVSDNTGYALKGVHINMYIEEEQIRFEINNRSASESGLKISYLLLKVARIVDTGKGNT
ncbi:exported hypothetical protein [Desulfamplus magnetovallimortis]|uniref:Transmembrane protein n=1 Tax=Desulfamplus magnetovallimortis TaxID=1246637 RepID=A0A1W1HIY9_9BACT|nr:YfiR family protein [Desulfamplus magnetovallimortis]SLM32385.1 exported hypothetical protein [Desulfamplus magnetovallimortis]